MESEIKQMAKVIIEDDGDAPKTIFSRCAYCHELKFYDPETFQIPEKVQMKYNADFCCGNCKKFSALIFSATNKELIHYVELGVLKPHEVDIIEITERGPNNKMVTKKVAKPKAQGIPNKPVKTDEKSIAKVALQADAQKVFDWFNAQFKDKSKEEKLKINHNFWLLIKSNC